MNKMGPATCDDCRCQPKNYGHKMRRVRCPSCAKEHSTKSGNLLCPRCQHQARKHPCPDCGRLCDKRAERCLACATNRIPLGAANPNWKGGRTVNRLTGYVRVKVHGHPRARPSNGYYVLEHVHVMEQHIGRFLLPGESVHHKNGQRDDNRIENLELWAKSQPAGQRTADLLAWAREIITMYEPIEEKIRC